MLSEKKANSAFICRVPACSLGIATRAFTNLYQHGERASTTATTSNTLSYNQNNEFSKNQLIRNAKAKTCTPKQASHGEKNLATLAACHMVP
jgi:hypothetical protein